MKIKNYVYDESKFNAIARDAYDKATHDRYEMMIQKFTSWTDDQMIAISDYLAKKYQKSRDSYIACPSWSKGGTMKHDEEVWCIVSVICDKRGITDRCFDPYEEIAA